MKLAIYPGSFDPVTNGHIDIVKRGAQLFDRVVIAVSENPHKKPYFPFAARLEVLRAVFRGQRHVVVEHFSGLLTDYFRRKKPPLFHSPFDLRGAR